MAWSDLVLLLALPLVLGGPARAQDVGSLRVGQWVTLKGTYQGGDRFVATEVTLSGPGEQHELLGSVERVERSRKRFWVLGQPIQVSPRTEWEGVSLASLGGKRVKVEGYYRGPAKFSSREVSLREGGRDRISGRIDRLSERADSGLDLSVLRFAVEVRADATVEVEGGSEPAALPLAPAVEFGTGRAPQDDDDDDVPQSISISDSLTAGLRLEWTHDDERELDLDRTDPGDRRDDVPALRADFLYDPEGSFSAFLGLRESYRWRDDEEDGRSGLDTFRLAELYGLWRDAAPGLDVQIGRQDFDDPREWLYDENLDAVRVRWRGATVRLELAAATFLSGGSAEDEETDYLMAYLSNADPDRHLAAYVIDARESLGQRDYPFHAGLRALGEWLPDHDMWLELALVSGYQGTTDLAGYGFDLGTTWSPKVADPWYLNLGLAFGSGDDQATGGTDEGFRQTGLQDNTSKLGGVTSYGYYGELLDPELSNLWIGTIGFGRRFGRSHSLDLLYHRYQQVEAADRLRDANLDRRPNGRDEGLGSELDLVWGSRWMSAWALEVVLAAFEPGEAFEDQDTAYYGKVQLRYRF